MVSQIFLDLPDRKKQNIQDVLMQYFLTTALADVRVNEIVSLLKMGKSQFYRYFVSLEDLYIYIFECTVEIPNIDHLENDRSPALQNLISTVSNDIGDGTTKDVLHYIMVQEMKLSHSEKMREYIRRNEENLYKRLEVYYNYCQKLRLFRKDVTIDEIFQCILYTRELMYMYVRYTPLQEINTSQKLHQITRTLTLGVSRNGKISQTVFNTVFAVIFKGA